MSTKSTPDYRGLFEPYANLIQESIIQGFRSRHHAYAEYLTVHTARTRASIINDHIVAEARRRLEPLKIRAFSFCNRILFDLRGQGLLHFKKLNRGLLVASNYPTQLALAFCEQADLPGIPSSVPRFVAGYVPRDDWASIEGVYITLPSAVDDVQWSMRLDQPIETEIFRKDERDHEENRKQRVRGKRSPDESGDERRQDAGGQS